MRIVDRKPIWSAIVAIALCRLGAAWVWAADPPKPDRDHPVDYVAWVNNHYALADRENAALKYSEAFAAYVDAPELFEGVFEAMKPTWREEDLAPLEKWVRANQPALAHLSVAAHMTKCYFPIRSKSGSLCDLDIDYPPKLRNIMKVVAVRARLRLVEGRVDAALDDIALVLRVARHMEMQPGLLGDVLGCAYREVAYNFLLGLPLHVPANTDYQAILAAVQRIDATPPTWGDAMLWERLLDWDVYQRCIKDEDGDGRPDAVMRKGEELLRLPPGMTWTDLLRGYEESFKICERIITQPDYPRAAALVATLDNPVVTEFLGVPLRLYDGWLSTQQKACEVRALRSAVRIVLRMHAHRAQRGCWPPDLAAAAGGEPPEMRIDLFSGREFVYRLTDGQPLLYSVNLDGRDDGGRWPRGGGVTFRNWTNTESGDYIFWPLLPQ